MKSFLLVVCFACASYVSYSQNLIKKALGVTLLIPPVKGWQIVEERLSKNIHTASNYNILTFSTGADIGNHFSLYGDPKTSIYIFSRKDFKMMQEKFKQHLPIYKKQIEEGNLPMEKVYSIIKEYYKENPKRYDSLVVYKDLLMKEVTFSTLEPELIHHGVNSFVYSISCNAYYHEDLIYSIRLTTGFLRLKNRIYGLSGAFDKGDTNDFFINSIKHFITNVITLNPSN